MKKPIDVFGKFKKSEVICLISIILTGIVLRIWWICHFNNTQVFDFATNYELAVNIFSGQGHTLNGVPVAWTGPGYPYALAIFYKIIGNCTEFSGKCFNIILSSLTLIMTALVYKRLFKSAKSYLAALAIFSFLPTIVAYNNVLGTEVLFSFLLTGLIFIQLFFINSKFVSYPLIGLLTGVLTLTKPIMLVYPVIAAVFFWVESKKLKRSFIFLGIVTICMLIPIAPWAVRNYNHYGKFMLTSYNLGYNMYVNNNQSNYTGSWMDLKDIAKSANDEETINSYLQNGRTVKHAYDLEPFLKSQASSWMRQNPMEYLKLCLMRFHQTFFQGANDVMQWSVNDIPTKITSQFLRDRNTFQSFLDITVYIINSFGIAFLFIHFKRYLKSVFTSQSFTNSLCNLNYINIAFFIVVYSAFEGQARYAYPVFFFMIPVFVYICEGFLISFKTQLGENK